MATTKKIMQQIWAYNIDLVHWDRRIDESLRHIREQNKVQLNHRMQKVVLDRQQNMDIHFCYLKIDVPCIDSIGIDSYENWSTSMILLTMPILEFWRSFFYKQKLFFIIKCLFCKIENIERNISTNYITNIALYHLNMGNANARTTISRTLLLINKIHSFHLQNYNKDLLELLPLQIA